MPTPALKDEFNGASNLLQGLFMWLFGVDANGNSNSAEGQGFMDILKKLFGGQAESPPVLTGGTAANPNPAETPPPATTQPVATTQTPDNKTARNVVTIGDSLAQGYGQALTREFGAANVTNYGVVGAGFKGGIRLAEVDWSKVNKDTVALISIGTNDVGYLSARNQARIDEYAQQVVDVAARAKSNGATAVLVAMRAPDKPLEIRDPVTKQMRPQTAEEFDAWKNTMTAMNDAISKAAAAQGIAFVTPEGGTYAPDGIHQTGAGYRATADNALRQAGVTVTNA